MPYNYSIIVPFHDKYDLFLKAVESIPDREDIQIIIADNAPEQLSKGQVPIKNKATITYTTSSATMGAGAARNAGLKHVKGRFIIFLDADDYFTPNAFPSFDDYLEKDFDIVYFQTDSINLKDGTRSNRHNRINTLVRTFVSNGNEDLLRYEFVNPVAKMLRTEFVLGGGFQFDEIRVSNDVWFSVMTGHAAKKITADEAVVYMITAGDSGGSLTKKLTKENWFTRYQVMVNVNKFLKSVGKYEHRIVLKGALRIAWKEFGFKEFLHFLKYAYDNKVGIF